MKVLVSGRSGQLATTLARQAPAGVELLFVARPEVDLSVSGALADAIRSYRPAVVVNAAAYTAVDRAEDEPELAHRINADAAGEAAAAAQQVGAGIVQISTDYVFDGRSDRPYRESDPVGAVNVYGRTKLAGEEQVRAANPRHAILRTAWVYGPFGNNFLKSMMAAVGTKPVLTVVEDQLGSPTYSLDLADAIFALVERYRGDGWPDEGATFHLAGSGVASWYELATAIMAELRALGLPASEVRAVGTEDWPTRATRPAYTALDSSRFASEIGFAMPAWQHSGRQAVRRLAGFEPA